MFRKFLADENGYALVLTLLFLPVFVGVGLLVIDIGRGNNAQSDLQAAADALALAGARELDQQTGAIADAKAAMERVTNRVNFLDISKAGSSILLNYDDADTDGRPFYVAFLQAVPGDVDPTDPTGKTLLPGDDNTPITDAFIARWITANDRLARYVLVQARSRDLNPFFFNPATRVSNNVPVAATAVATAKAYTCDLAPMYICNFPDLQNALNGGTLPHGKLYSLPMSPSNSTEPGNLGFLRTGDLLASSGDFGNNNSNGNPGGGTRLLMRALAGGTYERCISAEDRIYTQPGASPRALDALNTRFGYYLSNNGEFSPKQGEGLYPPALNVRKGWPIENGNTDCRAPPSNGEQLADTNARLQRNPIMSPNKTPLPNGDLWNLNQPAYLTPTGDVLQRGGTPAAPTYTIFSTGAAYTGDVIEYPAYWPALGQGQFNVNATFGRFPSRYEFYLYEIAENKLNLRTNVTPNPTNNETASPGLCFKNGSGGVNPNLDRRTMLMAIVDCAGQSINGTKPVATLGLAKVFLTHPATAGATTGSMNIEVFEVIRNLDQKRDNYLRTEVILVR